MYSSASSHTSQQFWVLNVVAPFALPTEKSLSFLHVCTPSPDGFPRCCSSPWSRSYGEWERWPSWGLRHVPFILYLELTQEPAQPFQNTSHSSLLYWLLYIVTVLPTLFSCPWFPSTLSTGKTERRNQTILFLNQET